MSTPTKCPKCDGEMQEGFILDSAHGHSRLVLRWVVGKPEPSFWTGTKVAGKEQHPVQSFRCAKCGYLESYAKKW
jgi:predicted nucleic-acid-binding Zn-ribbon protein